MLRIFHGPAGTRIVRAALLLGLIVLAGCGSSRALRTPAPSSGASRTASASESFGASRILLRGLENPRGYAAGGSLYIAEQVTPLGDMALSELIRVDPVTGGVRAVRRLGSAFDQAVLAVDALWVTTTRGLTSWLWRLDPDSLAVRSRKLLPGSGQNDGIVGTMALAGGWLWVGNSDRLDRVLPATSEVTAAVPVPGAQGIDVAADPAGRVLIVSEGHERARVQRRDSVTGALIAQSPVFEGVTKPYIGGISAGGVWISEGGGMMGAVERLGLVTLRPTALPGAQPHPGESGPPRIDGTNGIAARLIAGVLWVTQPLGGARRNYCGDPVSGQRRATLELPPQGSLLAVDPTSIYYITGASSPVRAELVRAPLNPRCRAGGPTASHNPRAVPSIHKVVLDVLYVSGIGSVRFGASPADVRVAIDSLLEQRGGAYTRGGSCRVNHEITWLDQWTASGEPALTVYFARSAFAGYQFGALNTISPPRNPPGGWVLATARGLRVGDTLARGQQLHGRSFATTTAQGGSWAVVVAAD